jgi:hypothetical protein
MAINTNHASLPEMYIGHETLVFSQVFIANSAPMAGRTSSGHGRFSDKLMSLKQTTADA